MDEDLLGPLPELAGFLSREVVGVLKVSADGMVEGNYGPLAKLAPVGSAACDEIVELFGHENELRAVATGASPPFEILDVTLGDTDQKGSFQSIHVLPRGDRSGTLLVFRDTTETAKLRREIMQERNELDLMQGQLVRAKEEAERANHAKRRFLAMMSHEIRTPMNGLLGMIQLLIDSGLDGERLGYARTAHQSASVLVSMMNQILDFSKIEAGKLELEETPFDLHEVVESAADLMAAHAQGKGLEVASLIEPGVPQRVIGDAVRLRQVLLNLLGNAVKFTSDGGATVSVVATDVADRRVRLRFAVTDTGVGIPAEAQGRLFGDYAQADASTSRKFGGTGLGLAICKQLVELMGGEISLESAAGRGTTFHFEISLHAEEDEPDGALPFVGERALVVAAPGIPRRDCEQHLARLGLVTESVGDLAAARAALPNGYRFVLVADDLVADSAPELAAGGASLVLVHPLARAAAARQFLDHGFRAVLPRPLKARAVSDALLRVESSAPDPTPTAPTAPDAAAATGARLLLCDDDPTNRLVAVAFLTRAGYEVELATNGQEAVDAALGRSYDLILMDMMMPVLNGLEATRAIRESPSRRRGVPILALTANEPAQLDADPALKLLDGHIMKPIDRDRMLATIAETLASRVLDGQALQALEDGVGAEIYPTLLDLYEQQLREALDALPADLEGEEILIAERRAHDLKSSAGTIGAGRLQERAREIEAACHQGNRAAGRALLTGLAEMTEEALQALARHRRQRSER